MEKIGGARVAGVEGEHFAGESLRFFALTKSERGLGTQEKRVDMVAQDKILVEEEHRG